MIVGIGIDALEVERMAREIAQDGRGFTNGLFLPAETAWCEARPDPAGAFAACFAAKEALIKALTLVRVDTAIYTEMEVRPVDGETSGVILSGRARAAAEAARVSEVHISCCRTCGVAVAAVVLES